MATIIGNVLVLYLIGKHLKCTSFTNSFISSMSLSDLAGLLFCAPLTLTTIVRQSWIMGNITCVFNSLLNNAFGITSTYMLACIVIDRYLVIAKVPRSEMTTKIAHGAMAMSWITAIILSIPWNAIMQNNFAKELYKPGFVHCTYVFHIVHSNEGTIHSVILIIIGYILPVAVMILCCVRIWNVLHRTDTGVQPASLAPTQLRLAGELKTAKTVLIMVLVYVFTKLPYVVTGIFCSALQVRMSSAMDTVMLYLFWTTGAVMPLVYAKRNEHFSEFLHIRRQTRAQSFTNISQSPRVPRNIQQQNDAHGINASHNSAQKPSLDNVKHLPRVNSSDLFNVTSYSENLRLQQELSKNGVRSSDGYLNVSRNNSIPYVVFYSGSRKGSDLSTVTTTTSTTLV